MIEKLIFEIKLILYKILLFLFQIFMFLRAVYLSAPIETRDFIKVVLVVLMLCIIGVSLYDYIYAIDPPNIEKIEKDIEKMSLEEVEGLLKELQETLDKAAKKVAKSSCLIAFRLEKRAMFSTITKNSTGNNKSESGISPGYLFRG